MKLRPMIHVEHLELRRLLSTYYVATNGSDSSGTGTLASPFASIQFAASLTQPGDVVNVEPGTYGGFIVGWDTTGLYGAINGTAAAPITIEADPSAVPGSVIVGSRNNKTPVGIDFEPGDGYINLQGFTVDNGDGSITNYGIKAAQSNNINILNNTVTGVGLTGIFTAFSDDDLIQGNVSYDNGEHGIYVSNSPTDVQILNNFAYGNANGGIQINADGTQGGTGIATDCVIANNEIFNNGVSGGGALNFDGMQDSIVENNLLYGNHSSGIVLFQEDGSAGSMNNIIANNTVVMASDARWAMEIDTNSTGNIVFNNIFLNANPNNGDISIDASSSAGFKSDHNVLEGTENLDDNDVTLAQWQAQTGQDLDSVVALPQAVFANPGANNYHLLNGSVAVGAGVASFEGIAAPNTDLQTHFWSDNHYDAGAYHVAMRTVPDVANPALLDLIVDGTAGNDSITFNPAAGGMIDVQVNGQDKGQFLASSLGLLEAFGGAGADTLMANASLAIPVVFNGDAGFDSLSGDSGNDTLAGNAGSDTIMANGAGNNDMLGGGGDNYVQGAAGNDTLYGGVGNSTLISGSGHDFLYAEAGNTNLYASLNSVDTVYGGPGQDTLHALGQISVPDNDISTVLPQ